MTLKFCFFRNALIAYTSILFITLFSFQGNSANRYWIATTAGNWSNAANWSATSGGPGSASVPTNIDNVFFDGAGGAIGNCIINTNATIIDITVSSAYTGIISQNNGNTIAISGNSIWSGGTFLGGNSTITNNGAFSLSGTLFTSTSGTLIIRNNFTFSSGSFIHNNGTTDFQNNSFSVNGSPTFYHLKNTPSYNTITINNSLNVAGNLTLNGTGAFIIMNTAANVSITVAGNLYKTGDNYAQFNTGTIDVKGDISITNTADGNGGTGTFNISGTTNQQLSSVAAAQFGRIPNIRINKPSGILTLIGTISIGGPTWTYVSGTVDAASSTVYFYSEPGGPYLTIAGTHSLNNVVLYPYYSTSTVTGNLSVNNFTMDGSSSSDIVFNSTLTVNQNFYMTGTDQLYINGGKVAVKGDILITNVNTSGGGNGTVQISGTTNQAITSTGAIGSGKLPNVVINKPSGTLSLSGFVSAVGPNWNYVSGGLNAGTSTVYLYRVPGGSDLIVSGTHTLNNLSISSYYSTDNINNHLTVNNLTLDGSTQHAVAVNSVVTVNGVLTTSGTDVLTLTTGTINVKGNIVYTNTHINSGGNATFIINGTANQNLTGSGVLNRSKLPANVILNKPSGNLVISGGVPFYFYNNLNFTQGILLSTNAQMAIFANGSAVTGTPSNSSYIDGPVRKIGNTLFTFPIGKNNLYAPIRISAPSNVAHAFTAEYFNADPNTSYSTSVKDASLDHVGRCEYWILDRTTGASNVSVTLSWDARSCGVTNLTELRVARWDGSQWRDCGNSAALGNTTTGMVTSTLVSSFSPFTLAGGMAGNNPLPITLMSFDAACDGSSVRLNWETASEINNDYFELERSADAEHWEKINQLDGNGISNLKHQYTLLDHEPLHVINYYRLKQVDLVDGRSTHSDIVAADVCEDILNALRIYPNPVSSSLNVSVSPSLPNLRIEIRDYLGRLVYEQKEFTDTINIDLSKLEKGVYILTATAANFTESLPLYVLME